jgi:hypothetical protein
MDSLLEEYGKRLEVLWSGDLENHPIGELPHVLQAVKADDLWLTDRLLVRAREKPGRTRQRAPPGPATDEQADGVVATLNAVMLGPGRARQETAGTIRTMTWFQGLSDPDTSDERIAHDFFELASSVEKIPDPDAFASRLEELEYSCRRQELDPCTLRRLSERLSQGVPAFSVPMLPATAERLDLFLALPLVLLVSFHPKNGSWRGLFGAGLAAFQPADAARGGGSHGCRPGWRPWRYFRKASARIRSHFSWTLNCSAFWRRLWKNLAIRVRARTTCRRRPWLEVTVSRVWPAWRVCRATPCNSNGRLVIASR